MISSSDVGNGCRRWSAPKVSASDGALLIPHLPGGQPRLGMLMACYAMFGISLVTLAISAGQVAQRSATTPGQQVMFRALDLPEPPKFFDFTIPDSD